MSNVWISVWFQESDKICIVCRAKYWEYEDNGGRSGLIYLKECWRLRVLWFVFARKDAMQAVNTGR